MGGFTLLNIDFFKLGSKLYFIYIGSKQSFKV